jgi:hypothetical protein
VAIRLASRRGACPTISTREGVTIADGRARPLGGERALVASYQEIFLFSCLPDSLGFGRTFPDCTVTSAPIGISERRRARRLRATNSFGVGSRVRYCTVTSVPTGISEKSLRAVSSGNRMQPCDAG